MPTGYTAALHDGEEVTFEQFALKCARAFGALIMMREDPLDAKIPMVFEPNLYHFEQLRRANERLAKAQSMTLAEAGQLAEATAARLRLERVESLKNAEARWARYEAVLTKVKAWEPPTPDHESLKKFMIEQIESSTRHDCDPSAIDGYRAEVKVEPAEEYLADEIRAAQHNINYHTAEWAKEQERTKERSEWVHALYESLGTKP